MLGEAESNRLFVTGLVDRAFDTGRAFQQAAAYGRVRPCSTEPLGRKVLRLYTAPKVHRWLLDPRIGDGAGGSGSHRWLENWMLVGETFEPHLCFAVLRVEQVYNVLAHFCRHSPIQRRLDRHWRKQFGVDQGEP